ncbi:hypothetical protein Cpir12675_003139 [Ceratocystis pirilliformis]|uniref:Uncharacterized protein n=1 Tax=Ceratocystis pirilliformis TaxID=259994 RepID=A0ABR3Z532_9PEZI
MNVLLRSVSSYRGISQSSTKVPHLSVLLSVQGHHHQNYNRDHSTLALSTGTNTLARNLVHNTPKLWATRSFSSRLTSWNKSQKTQAPEKNTIPVAPISNATVPASVSAKKPTVLEVHEDIYTLPNILTFSRLLASPAIGYLILHDHRAWAVGLFAYAGITDMLDGWIARKWNQRTVVGTVIDPAADKALMTILTVCLAMKGGLPVWLAVIILGRDVGLAISAIYYRYISLPAPKTFKRYWDLSIPSAEVHPTTISKVNTALQLGLIGLATAAPIIPYDLTTVLNYFQYIVATTTIWSGASYIYSKDAVKILKKM